MLLFRDEEHAGRWCAPRYRRAARRWRRVGPAQAWHGPDRRDPEWRRRTVEGTEALFASLGLTGDCWRLR